MPKYKQLFVADLMGMTDADLMGMTDADLREHI